MSVGEPHLPRVLQGEPRGWGGRGVVLEQRRRSHRAAVEVSRQGRVRGRARRPAGTRARPARGRRGPPKAGSVDDEIRGTSQRLTLATSHENGAGTRPRGWHVLRPGQVCTAHVRASPLREPHLSSWSWPEVAVCVACVPRDTPARSTGSCAVKQRPHVTEARQTSRVRLAAQISAGELPRLYVLANQVGLPPSYRVSGDDLITLQLVTD